ncbi:winged helix-turn-helix domain-containing protein [Nocardioides pocheonensis]|uniref:Winged helix-turn-helix domain-containing protein n=1 Tax=Nocardioides pocheonensis TaxID=661485 RepID=A0A3N0GNC3_9ACTN|nr:crosslink repair DNA glycosylase YcaQ family protein [Nocardioides pocheonensis]RNM13600.1 winged helix-turn-helix domain-containing protein [Nocardioides pocheonensis]
MQSLSRAQARRIAVAAQGFLDPRHATPDLRTLNRTVARTGVLQIDSVNVLQRAHYMPLFSRMGPYDMALLDRASGRAPRRLVEYWAHVAAFMPVDLWPHMQHRMRHYRDRGHPWMAGVDFELASSLLGELDGRGRRTARDLDDGLPRDKQHWGWNWSEAKKALEYLFLAGEVAVAGRNAQFERVYDLPERVIPRAVLELPVPSDEEAHRELVRRAAVSHGVATARDLRDYYRMPVAQAGPAIATLVDDGELVPVEVEGWRQPAYLHRDARIPRRVAARALLSPFDPLVWERARTEALFDFHYRIEIYVPEEKRVHGYYVLPFLLGDRIVGRVDLKADRKVGVLRVHAAYAEPGAPPETATELAAELRSMAGWLGLADVVVARRGDLAASLRGALQVG